MSLSPFDADFYDGIFEAKTREEIYISNSLAHIARLSHFCVGSVLDIACGLGQLSNHIDNNQYVGIDFSPFAILWAQKNSANPNAQFVLSDLADQLMVDRSFDTVVLSEILEHVDDPALLANYAKKVAKHRIIIALPINMPMEGHIKSAWTRSDIEALFGAGALLLEQGCKTPKGIPLHWHIVYELDGKLKKPIQNGEIVRFVHNPVAALPAVCLPEGYKLEAVVTPAQIDEYLQFIASSKEFINPSPEYYRSVVIRFMLPAGVSVIKYKGQIVACNAIVDFKRISKQANLTYFFVLPEHRKKGIGSYLFVLAIKQAYNAGYRSIRFLTQESRQDAIRLYEKLGFIRE